MLTVIDYSLIELLSLNYYSYNNLKLTFCVKLVRHEFHLIIMILYKIDCLI